MRLQIGQYLTNKGVLFCFVLSFYPESKERSWTMKDIHVSGRTIETAAGKGKFEGRFIKKRFLSGK